MKRKIPESITIGGLEIKVQYDEDLTCFGLYNHRNNTITILETLSEQQKQTTLIHEALEAIKFIYEIDLPHETLCVIEVALFSGGFWINE